ncbi:MAG: Fe-S cluster assembly protein IscX [Bdellovibrionales bacterium]
MAEKQPQRQQESTAANLIGRLRARSGLNPASPKNLQWVDIDTISQTLHSTYPLLDPETIKARDLLTLVTNLRFFGDTQQPPNSLYVDMIREGWMEAVAAENRDQEKIS